MGEPLQLEVPLAEATPPLGVNGEEGVVPGEEEAPPPPVGEAVGLEDPTPPLLPVDEAVRAELRVSRALALPVAQALSLPEAEPAAVSERTGEALPPS